MLEKYVRVGDKVELRLRHGILTEEEEKALKIYLSKINMILDEDKVEILMPIEQSRLVLLPRNVIFVMVVYTSNGLYQCDVKMTERYKSGNIALQVVELISPLKRFQRREYYRYSCNIPVLSRNLTEEEQEMFVLDETLEKADGWALDIGGGGVRFCTEQKYVPRELVVCELQLEVKDSVKSIETIGRVLSVKPIKDSGTFETRVQFKRISNKDRETIIQYIFEDERKRRKLDNGF